MKTKEKFLESVRLFKTVNGSEAEQQCCKKMANLLVWQYFTEENMVLTPSEMVEFKISEINIFVVEHGIDNIQAYLQGGVQ